MTSFVRFQEKPKENPVKSREAGRKVFEPRLYVQFTKIGGDEVEFRADDAYLDRNMYNPQQRPEAIAKAEAMLRAYETFKQGKETTVDGMPVENWAAIERTDAENLKQCGVFTVEQLAQGDAAFLEKYGIGAGALVDRAREYLKSAEDHGKVVEEISMLKDELATLKESMAEKDEQIGTQASIIEELRKKAKKEKTNKEK